MRFLRKDKCPESPGILENDGKTKRSYSLGLFTIPHLFVVPMDRTLHYYYNKQKRGIGKLFYKHIYKIENKSPARATPIGTANNIIIHYCVNLQARFRIVPVLQ